jgi:shikimate dehydrogenase
VSGARHFAVIGDPVGHSVSPPMQQAAFRSSGIDADYVALRVGADDLPSAWIELCSDFEGLNVTRPLKQIAAGLVDDVAPSATASGTVNTVVRAGGRVVGESTDGEGFLAALRRVRPEPVDRAVILGTGGATRAVAAALAANGSRVQIVGRNGSAGERLADDLTSRLPTGAPGSIAHAGGPDLLAALLPGTDLLVNATPMGDPSLPDAFPLPDDVRLDALDPPPVVFDLIYRPRRTALLRRAATGGCPVVEGIEMLIEQGARSFELWTGAHAPVDVMRRAAFDALDAGSDPAGDPAHAASPEAAGTAPRQAARAAEGS